MGREWDKSKIDEALFSFDDGDFNFKDNAPFKGFGVRSGKLESNQLHFLQREVPAHFDDHVCALNRLVLHVIMVHKWAGVALFGCVGMSDFLFNIHKGKAKNKGQ